MATKKIDGFRSQKRGKTLNLFIYDEISPFDVNAREIADAIEAAGDLNKIDVFINSPGGSIFEALAIFNQFRRAEPTVNMFIDGVAASAAAFVAMAGDEITIAENAFIIIHNPSGLVVGESKDMKMLADRLDMLRDSIVAMLAGRSGQTEKQVALWMDAETWFTAEEAVDLGFADVLGDEKDVDNKFDLSVFSNLPEAMRARSGDVSLSLVNSAASCDSADIFGVSNGAKPVSKEVPKMATTFTEAEVNAKIAEAKADFATKLEERSLKARTEAENLAKQVAAEADAGTTKLVAKAEIEASEKAAKSTTADVLARVDDILAKCELSNIPLAQAREMAKGTLEDAKDAIIDAFNKDRTPVGGTGTGDLANKKDPADKIRAEFKASGGQAKLGCTEAQYVESCLCTDAGGQVIE